MVNLLICFVLKCWKHFHQNKKCFFCLKLFYCISNWGYLVLIIIHLKWPDKQYNKSFSSFVFCYIFKLMQFFYQNVKKIKMICQREKYFMCLNGHFLFHCVLNLTAFLKLFFLKNKPLQLSVYLICFCVF